MTFQTLRMYNHLKKHCDGLRETTDGTTWAQVCSADIKLAGITPAQVGGYLRALEQAGFYRKLDKYFGMVKL